MVRPVASKIPILQSTTSEPFHLDGVTPRGFDLIHGHALLDAVGRDCGRDLGVKPRVGGNVGPCIFLQDQPIGFDVTAGAECR